MTVVQEIDATVKLQGPWKYSFRFDVSDAGSSTLRNSGYVKGYGL